MAFMDPSIRTRIMLETVADKATRLAVGYAADLTSDGDFRRSEYREDLILLLSPFLDDDRKQRVGV